MGIYFLHCFDFQTNGILCEPQDLGSGTVALCQVEEGTQAHLTDQVKSGKGGKKNEKRRKKPGL